VPQSDTPRHTRSAPKPIERSDNYGSRLLKGGNASEDQFMKYWRTLTSASAPEELPTEFSLADLYNCIIFSLLNRDRSGARDPEFSRLLNELTRTLLGKDAHPNADHSSMRIVVKFSLPGVFWKGDNKWVLAGAETTLRDNCGVQAALDFWKALRLCLVDHPWLETEFARWRIKRAKSLSELESLASMGCTEPTLLVQRAKQIEPY